MSGLNDDFPAIDSTVLDDLERQTEKLSNSLGNIVKKLTNKLHETSAITVANSQTYSSAIEAMGVEIDDSMKSMYMLIAHCEELDKAMVPVYKVGQSIKKIQNSLLMLEAQVAQIP
ncbi:BLOC-1-related complex subunit 6-like [Styela clava]|uniref:uncharacterized protein LOC120326800 n=1 Tax=Styela clava TaxID=7725 RepID=UPI001939D4B4|nr:uncharacterized protein LOC120326800 [Styela clava]